MKYFYYNQSYLDYTFVYYCYNFHNISYLLCCLLSICIYIIGDINKYKDLYLYLINGYFKIHRQGLYGLNNQNTCFLNSCIQALSHTYELNEILNSNKFKKYIKKIDDSEILNEYNDLVNSLESKWCSITK